MNCLAGELEEAGFAIVPGVLSEDKVNRLLAAIEGARREHASFKRGGIRNLLDRAPEVQALTESAPVLRLVEAVLGAHAFAARGMLFDKMPEANWKVPWIGSGWFWAVDDQGRRPSCAAADGGTGDVGRPDSSRQLRRGKRAAQGYSRFASTGPVERRANQGASAKRSERVVSYRSRWGAPDAASVAARFVACVVSGATARHPH